MLIKQRQLRDNNRAQGQQLRPLIPLTGILTRHAKTPLNNPLKGSIDFERN
jgi:hypothetical protein